MLMSEILAMFSGVSLLFDAFLQLHSLLHVLPFLSILFPVDDSLDYHRVFPVLLQKSFKLFPLLLHFCPLIYYP